MVARTPPVGKRTSETGRVRTEAMRELFDFQGDEDLYTKTNLDGRSILLIAIQDTRDYGFRLIGLWQQYKLNLVAWNDDGKKDGDKPEPPETLSEHFRRVLLFLRISLKGNGRLDVGKIASSENRQPSMSPMEF